MNKKDQLIYQAKKIVAIALILVPIYNIYDAVRDMLIVFPQLAMNEHLSQDQTLYVSLLKKAIVISSSLVFDSFYGFVLLVKPKASTKLIHVLLGLLILIVSQVIFRLNAIDKILSQIHLFPLI
jgi:hypothetical protein